MLISGPSEVGKSYIAQALGHEAYRHGYDVLYFDTPRMLQHLNGGRADATYEQRLQNLMRPDLLILDDFGLRPLAPFSADDSYDVINERYAEASAILLTSSRAPTEWAARFGSPVLASAGLDRWAHNARVILITGPPSTYPRTPATGGDVPTHHDIRLAH